jgi:acetolactate synthase-1/2/3 large subunit
LRGLTELQPPVLDWSALARGFGVAAVKVDTADGLVKHLDRMLRESGPSLIEAAL